MASGGAKGGTRGFVIAISQKSAKFSKKNGTKLVRCTFKQKNYVYISPLLSNFRELALPGAKRC